MIRQTKLLSNLILTISFSLVFTFSAIADTETNAMALHHSSQHFDFYSTENDSKTLNNISKKLEKNYDRITEHLQTQFSKKIRVLIYPNIESFHKAIHKPNAPGWVVGTAAINELKMVSPLNPGKVHTYQSLMQVIVHELVHTAVLNMRTHRGLVGLPEWFNGGFSHLEVSQIGDDMRRGLVRLPKWLSEGYAFYEAEQMTDDMREAAKLHSQKNAPPSWVELDKANTAEFGKIHGYTYSVLIIEFLVTTYGFEKLIELIKEPEDIEAIYGRTKENLEKLWLSYIKN